MQEPLPPPEENKAKWGGDDRLNTNQSNVSDDWRQS